MKENRSLTVALLGANLIAVALIFWLVKVRHPRSSSAALSAPPSVVNAPALAPSPSIDHSIDSPAALASALLDDLVNRIASARDARANEALISFKDAQGYRRFVEAGERKGISISGKLDALNALRVRFTDALSLRQLLQDTGGDFQSIGPNYTLGFPRTPPPEQRAVTEPVPFANTMLSFLGVTSNNIDWGRGVTIAVLDSGVSTDPTFGEGRVRAIDVGLGINPGTGAEDGHATAVSSLAAGQSPEARGVAPSAHLLSVRVTDATGTSDLFTLSQGILAAANAGAQIINISMGGYGTTDVLNRAIDYASSHGSLIVAAAGNDQAAQLTWPAADPRVLSVGAVDAAGQQVSFSNSGDQLKLTAPGYGVQTAWLNNQRVLIDGTSASAPIVSGAIAAVMSQTPGLTAAQAADVLQKYASDAGQPGRDSDYGNGILNVGWAMNRTDATYMDMAVAGHYFDSATQQMEFLVQNRGNQPVSGGLLRVDYGNGLEKDYPLPQLSPGASYEAKLPLESSLFAGATTVSFTTRLTNPAGLIDRVPGNNFRSSVLTQPTKK